MCFLEDLSRMWSQNETRTVDNADALLKHETSRVELWFKTELALLAGSLCCRLLLCSFCVQGTP